jgi:drug/metabolite transporter (DMT)-like permease
MDRRLSLSAASACQSASVRHQYFNSMAAVFLGWLFFREPFGWRELVAMVVIFAGVAVVTSESRKPAHV